MSVSCWLSPLQVLLWLVIEAVEFAVVSFAVFKGPGERLVQV